MSKKSMSDLPKITPESALVVTKPARKARKKKSPPVDLSGIVSGMQETFQTRLAEETNVYINEALKIPEKIEKKNEGKELEDNPALDLLEEKIQRQKDKIKRRQKNREEESEPDTKEGGRQKTKQDPSVESFERELNKRIEENGKNHPKSETSEVDKNKAEEVQKENELDADELHELLVFVDAHRDSLLKKYNEEKNSKEKKELQRKLEVADYRIETLNKARIYLLNPTEGNKPENDDWTKIREDVREKIEMEKEEKDREEKKKIENSEKPTEITNQEKELYGPYKYIENHRDFLINLLNREGRKKKPNQEKISQLETNIDGMDRRMFLLKKAKESLLNPTNVTLTKKEKSDVEEIKKEVLDRIAEQKAKKEINQNQKTKPEEISTPSEEPAQEEVKNSTETEMTPVPDFVSKENPSIISNKATAKEKVVEKGSRPLKTQYEKAIDRQNAIDRGDIVRKTFVGPKIKDENILSFENKNLSIENRITKAKNFNELLAALETVEGIQGKEKWFSKYSLIGRVNLVRAGEITTDYIPTFGEINLRGRVEEFLKSENSLTYKPVASLNKAGATEKEVEIKTEEATIKDTGGDEVFVKKTTQDREKIPSPENNAEHTDEDTPSTTEASSKAVEPVEKEGDFRKKISYLFGDVVAQELSKVKLSRVAYGKQLKIETQHEHDQARLSWFKKKLTMSSFTKKANANAEILKKAQDEYNLNLENLKNIVNDEKLTKEAIDKALDLGDRGLEIIAEEKAKLFEKIKAIDIEEKKLIQGLREDGLPEKDRKTIDRIAKLYAVPERGMLRMLNAVIHPNENKDNV